MKRVLAFSLLMAGSPLDAGEIVKPLDEFVIYNISSLPIGQHHCSISLRDFRLYAKSVACRNRQMHFLLVHAGKFLLHGPRARAGRRTISASSSTGGLRSALALKAILLRDVLPGRQPSPRRTARGSREMLSLLDAAKRIRFSECHPDALAMSSTPRQTPQLLRQFLGGRPRRVAVRGETPDLPHRPRKHVGPNHLLQAPGPAIRLEDRIYTQSLPTLPA